MRALTKYFAVEYRFAGHEMAWEVPAAAATATENAHVPAGRHIKNVALFLAAPFIGLAYFVAFPLIGFGVLIWLAGKKLLANKTARPIVLMMAAPFATLALVTVAPVAGLGALTWFGGRALLRR